jgi:hypothetical protein
MDANVGVTGRDHKRRWFRACRIVVILVQAVNASDEAAKSTCVFQHRELRKDDAWCHVDTFLLRHSRAMHAPLP